MILRDYSIWFYVTSLKYSIIGLYVIIVVNHMIEHEYCIWLYMIIVFYHKIELNLYIIRHDWSTRDYTVKLKSSQWN